MASRISDDVRRDLGKLTPELRKGVLAVADAGPPPPVRLEAPPAPAGQPINENHPTGGGR